MEERLTCQCFSSLVWLLAAFLPLLHSNKIRWAMLWSEASFPGFTLNFSSPPHSFLPFHLPNLAFLHLKYCTGSGDRKMGKDLGMRLKVCYFSVNFVLMITSAYISLVPRLTPEPWNEAMLMSHYLTSFPGSFK